MVGGLIYAMRGGLSVSLGVLIVICILVSSRVPDIYSLFGSLLDCLLLLWVGVFFYRRGGFETYQ